ncbi:MAG TPA: RluA family pseudouridine synthase [Euzebya sp.]|nr:RluA family pseudouridine synthase [Euzebya sp.]
MTEPLLARTTAPEEEGDRLDVVLAGWLGESRSRTQARIDAGEVALDGQVPAKSTRLVADQVVVVQPAPVRPTPIPPPVAIRHLDDDIAVVVKPADLVVHDGAGVRGATMVDALLAQGVSLAASADTTRPGIVHRLDRGTSGLLVVARSARALVALKRTFAAHDVHREYWVLVEGHPDPPAATIDAPIMRSTSNRTAFTTGDGGRHAITHYDTVAWHTDTAELTVTLETGRTHQVRVHLRAIGRPVAGDVLYGASPQRAAALGLTHQALHARRLAFDHPVTGQRMDLTEPLPDMLSEARRRAMS